MHLHADKSSSCNAGSEHYLHSLIAAILLDDEVLHDCLRQGCQAARKLAAHDDHAAKTGLTWEARDLGGLADSFFILCVLQVPENMFKRLNTFEAA